MRFHFLFSTLAVAIVAAAFVPAAPAAAQIIEIGGDGSVSRFDGPVVTTSTATEAIVLAGRTARTRSLLVPPTAVRAAVQPVTLTHARVAPAPALSVLFDQAARSSGVDPRLLHAVAWQETRFRHGEVSPKGAIGMMQLMPDTARDLGVDPYDLIQNLAGGARLLATLLRRYGGNIELTLAAYNAGPGAVARYGGVPPYAETREYVRRIKQVLLP